MSSWNGKDIERWEPMTFPDRPGWVAVDCGCCNGIVWGGCEPEPCGECWETGWLYIHASSGVMAEWPGGPLRGKADPYLRDLARSVVAA